MAGERAITSAPMTTRNPIADFIEGIPGNAVLGLQVTEMVDGHGTVVLPFRPDLTNHVGTVHAMALFGIADACSGAALFAGLGDLVAAVAPIARGGEITYRKPATGAITGRATVDAEQQAAIRTELDADGVTRPDVVVTMTNEDDVVVAEATFHWHIKRTTA